MSDHMEASGGKGACTFRDLAPQSLSALCRQAVEKQVSDSMGWLHGASPALGRPTIKQWGKMSYSWLPRALPDYGKAAVDTGANFHGLLPQGITSLGGAAVVMGCAAYKAWHPRSWTALLRLAEAQRGAAFMTRLTRACSFQGRSVVEHRGTGFLSGSDRKGGCNIPKKALQVLSLHGEASQSTG